MYFAKISGAVKSGVAKIGGILLLEDLSMYTEVDTNGRISISTTRATITNLKNNESALVYYDFGADAFNALGINLECRLTSAENGAGVTIVALTTATRADASALSSSEVSIHLYRNPGGEYRLYLARGNFVASDYYAISADTTYYLSMQRAANNDTITLKIYAEYARTTLLATLSVSGFSTTKYRYLYAVMNYNDGASVTSSGWVDKIML